MGRSISDFNGTVVAPGGDYSYGRVKNAPSGTVADETMLGDVIQTFMRAADLANITLNGDPDNDANGYQYAQALGLEEWQDGGTLTFAAIGGGSVSISQPGDIAYNKYKIVGKTLYYQLRIITGTISGTVTGIAITLPFLSGAFPNANFGIPGMYLTTNELFVQLQNPFGVGITLNRVGSIPFNTGTNDQTFDINIVAELP